MEVRAADTPTSSVRRVLAGVLVLATGLGAVGAIAFGTLGVLYAIEEGEVAVGGVVAAVGLLAAVALVHLAARLGRFAVSGDATPRSRARAVLTTVAVTCILMAAWVAYLEWS